MDGREVTGASSRSERELLLDVAFCPIVERCKAGAPHVCSKVVAVQRDVPIAEHQVPEPWTGHLSRALVLFISSNPSISLAEDYPVWSSERESVLDYFDDRFEGQQGQVRDGVYGPLKDGDWSRKATRYWAWCRSRAAELMPEPQPGLDYALTEVVHCKSRGEIGVKDARKFCSERYLPRVLDNARAAVVVAVVGAQALPGVNSALGLDLSANARVAEIDVESRQRYVVLLDHPAGFKDVKRFASATDSETLQEMRTGIAEARNVPR